jgi:Predicted transcriptional regulator
MDESLPGLGDLEREVMQLVWANGSVTAELVRERLDRRLKESTVRTVLRRLEEKGYVTHDVDGRTYVYHPTQPRGRVAAKAVQGIVDWFCNGSIEEVLVGMVDSACSISGNYGSLRTRSRRQSEERSDVSAAA